MDDYHKDPRRMKRNFYLTPKKEIEVVLSHFNFTLVINGINSFTTFVNLSEN